MYCALRSPTVQFIRGILLSLAWLAQTSHSTGRPSLSAEVSSLLGTGLTGQIRVVQGQAGAPWRGQKSAAGSLSLRTTCWKVPLQSRRKDIL